MVYRRWTSIISACTLSHVAPTFQTNTLYVEDFSSREVTSIQFLFFDFRSDTPSSSNSASILNTGPSKSVKITNFNFLYRSKHSEPKEFPAALSHLIPWKINAQRTLRFIDRITKIKRRKGKKKKENNESKAATTRFIWMLSGRFERNGHGVAARQPRIFRVQREAGLYF